MFKTPLTVCLAASVVLSCAAGCTVGEQSPTYKGLPAKMYKNGKTQHEIAIDLKDPPAKNVKLTLEAYDPDQPQEGEIWVNGQKAACLFGNQAKSANAKKLVKELDFVTAKEFWKRTGNKVEFRRIRGVGFNVPRLIVSQTSETASIEPNILAASASTLKSAAASAPKSIASSGCRDPFKHPFSSTSIWNTPLGSNAEYVDMNMKPADGIQVDPVELIWSDQAPLINVYHTEYGWQKGATKETRCTKANNKVLYKIRVPQGYETKFYGRRPNNPAVLFDDAKKSFIQTAPFQVCGGGTYATTNQKWQVERINTNDISGIKGMHGGSGLSSLGGTIRLGELTEGAPDIDHVIKISFPGKYLYNAPGLQKKDLKQWPAMRADKNGLKFYGGNVPAARQGALWALPPNLDINKMGLTTEPAKKIAKVLQNYGAYQVEGVPWSRMMLIVEQGPQGSVQTEFKESWGFDMVTTDKNSPWYRDMMKIMQEVHVVANNGPNSVGGGGKPRVSLTAPFCQ